VRDEHANLAGESNDAAAPQAIPVVFVVDDDVSVRESVELLVLSAGWRPQTFASARDFLARPRVVAPSCLVLDVHLPDLNGLDLQERIVDRSTCRSSSSRVTATFR